MTLLTSGFKTCARKTTGLASTNIKFYITQLPLQIKETKIKIQIRLLKISATIEDICYFQHRKFFQKFPQPLNGRKIIVPMYYYIQVYVMQYHIGSYFRIFVLNFAVDVNNGNQIDKTIVSFFSLSFLDFVITANKIRKLSKTQWQQKQKSQGTFLVA